MAKPRTHEGPHIKFGNRLRDARAALGWNQSRAAVKAEDTGLIESMSHETLRRMEAGEVAESDVPTMRIIALAQAYGVPVSRLSRYHADRLPLVSASMQSAITAERFAANNPDPDPDDDGPDGGESMPADLASHGSWWTGDRFKSRSGVDLLAAA